MKVLILSHMFPNCRDMGMGIFVLEQAKRLRAAGVETFIVSPTPWAPHRLQFLSSVRKYSSMPAHENVSGFSVEHPRVPTLPKHHGFALSGLLFWLSCRKHIREYLAHNEIDLIHAHAVMPDGFAAVLLGREFGLPVVCTVHGSDVNVYPRAHRSVAVATRWALRRVDKLIAVSESLKKSVLDLSGPREVLVANNGADPQVFRPQTQRYCRSELGLPVDNKIICFVGYLRSEKAINVLLEAVARLQTKNVTLCLAGDGPLRGELFAQAEKLGISHSCIFAGAQAHERVSLWIGAADCLVLCSLSEGLPTVLPEAMLCRVPVVATPVGGVPEIVCDGKTGILVPPGRSVELARAIDRLLSDKQLSDNLAQNAYAFAKDSLTWDANVRKTIAAYQAALGKSSSIPVRKSDHSSTAAQAS
jgi:glycosyltransferase involved in cell wall biosynthesis